MTPTQTETGTAADPPANPEVIGFIKSELARFTKRDVDSIADDAGLVELGLESIDAVILVGNVEDRFEIELDPEAIFGHETLIGFAAEVSAKLRDGGSETAN